MGKIITQSLKKHLLGAIISAILILIFLGIWISVISAQATSFNDQLDNSTGFSHSASYNSNFQTLGAGNGETLQGIYLYLDDQLQAGEQSVAFSEVDGAVDCLYYSNFGNNSWRENSFEGAVSSSIFYFDFNISYGGAPTGTIYLDPAKTYLITLKNSYASQSVWGSSSSAAYPDGEFSEARYLPPFVCNTKGDMYMDFVFSSSTAIASLNWVNPVNGTTTADFQNWVIESTWNSATTTVGRLKIYYYMNASSSGLYQDEIVLVSSPSTSTVTNFIPKTNLLYFPPNNPNGENWGAIARLYNSSTTFDETTMIAESGIDFTVVASSTFSSTSTLSDLNTTCDNTDGFFANSLCKMLTFLFYPSQQSLDNFLVLKNTLSTKPPLGYFAIVANSISGLQEGASSTLIISASTTAAFSPVFSPIKNVLIVLLWLLFGFWVYKRFRHIEV